MKLLDMHANTACRVNKRVGAAGLMLVLILTLLIGTFAASLGRRAADERRNEHQHQTVAILDSAIDSVAASGLEGDATIRLPIDPTGQRWVSVESVAEEDATAQGNTGRQYQATLYHNNQPGLSIQRRSRSDP